MGEAMVLAIVLCLGISLVSAYTVTEDIYPNRASLEYPKRVVPRAVYPEDDQNEHSALPLANHGIQGSATAYEAYPGQYMKFSAQDAKSYGNHYLHSYDDPNEVSGNTGSHEKIIKEYSQDPDFQNAGAFLDTKGYTQYKTSTSFNIEGPQQVEHIKSKSFHKEVEPYDLGEFEHKHISDEDHAEVHYHQHKHLHKHSHKQEHVHKHKQEHKHHHGHKHQEQAEHQHKHENKHHHQHDQHHQHKHVGEHQHQHHSDHKHEHKNHHKHEHSHNAEHKHEQHHSHKHEHDAEHKHEHNGEHKHDHHHSHKHHGHHKHQHKHNGHHSHHHGHKHQGKHIHHSHHKHTHKQVKHHY